MIDYRQFDSIVAKIDRFRKGKSLNESNYKEYRAQCFERELKEIYFSDIFSGNTRTRETKDDSISKFLRTKANNMRDYADACFRYLRATGLVNISHLGKSISIAHDKMQEVDYFLSSVDREPCFVDDESRYIEYLGNPQIPALLTDNREQLIHKLKTEFPQRQFSDLVTLRELKDILDDEMEGRKSLILSEQVTTIKKRLLFEEIKTTFTQILDNSLYDAPLMLEWNTWRAMTMIDGGRIIANLKFDDFGNPMSTAQGNTADIVCDYGDFGLTVEVTMQSGQRQYETEGEPVARHLAKYKKDIEKPVYCLFIAPSINDACKAYFYALHKMNIQFYGGTSTIVPLPLKIFIEMLEKSYHAKFIPKPSHIKQFFELSNDFAKSTENEIDWFNKITLSAIEWLSI